MALARELAPFGGAAALTWLAIAVSSPAVIWTQYLVSLALLGVTVLCAFQRLPGRRTAWLGVLPASFLFLLAVGVLRNSAGGLASGAGVLSLVCVFYVALHATRRRDMFSVLVAMAAFYLLPLIFIGAPRYPDSQYRSTVLTLAVSSIIGFATQALVRRVRAEAREAHLRGSMLEEVNATVRGLFGGANVRSEICEAATRISRASAALLYEPTETGTLRCTATSGFIALSETIEASSASAVYTAFRSKHPELITAHTGVHVGSVALWEAAGRPASILYEPLMKDGRAVGVLAIAWPGPVTAGGVRATVAALLAHEAAGVIHRSDAIEHLADEAQTDALTGLPNRRAWDAALARAGAAAAGSGSDGPDLTVALIDLDRFKQYNDTYGHPAGDQLLRETAAAWREQLRPGDLLARIGGEEFGLLLDCGLEDALDIVERLRDTVTEGRTCSAGVAVRRSSEGLDSVITRADQALYRAKTTGRDRVHQSV